MSVKTAEEHAKRTLELMKQHNVVLGIVSSTSVAVVEQWEAVERERILRGISFDDPGEFMKPDELDALLQQKSWTSSGRWEPSTPAIRRRIPPSLPTGPWPKNTAFRSRSTPEALLRGLHTPAARSFVCGWATRSCW